MVVIEPPRLKGGSEKEQLRELQSYLHRTAQQLQWAFDTLSPGDGTQTPVSGPPQTPEENAQAVFPGIKNLIIKSADIVEAYTAVISKRLAGSYLAKSEFGTYREQTAQTIQADSQKLTQLFEHQQSLQDTLDSLWDETRASNAYVRSGCLGRDAQGDPIYGLEVGQSNTVDGKPVFQKFARFTADRLSFFDSSDVEVAFISDHQLCISNARISGTLTIGGQFRIYGGNGLVFQWTGGNG